MARTGTSLVAATATHLAMSMALPPPSPTTRSQPEERRSSTASSISPMGASGRMPP